MDEIAAVEGAEKQTEAQAGLCCRACGCRHFQVYSTRRRDRYVQRVRVCRHCGKRLVTNERAVGGGMYG